MSRLQYTLYSFVLTFLLIIDAATKRIASLSLATPHQIFEFKNCTINLYFHKNYGIGFGLLSKHPNIVLCLFPISLIGLVAIIKRWTEAKKWLLLIIFAGATGNFIDRLRLGYVIDFISVCGGNYCFPTFNIADCLVVFGMLGLSLIGF